MPFLRLVLFDVLAKVSVIAVLKEDVEGVFVILWLKVVDDPHNILVLDFLQLQGLGYQIALQLQAQVAQVADFEHHFLLLSEVIHEVNLRLATLADLPHHLILCGLQVDHLVADQL